ncbi:hypothetical protein SVIOM342S_07837 [Streptomyces violaceorubidus]
MCELFAEALDLDDDEVSAVSDFMALGGHSMLAVRLTGLLRREYGPVITIRDLFTLRTPEAIAHQRPRRRLLTHSGPARVRHPP